ncbi:MAG: ATP-binding protein [Anaerolineae bacterium]|nr:ATP-binding protein [Anaerolineae bacterium]
MQQLECAAGSLNTELNYLRFVFATAHNGGDAVMRIIQYLAEGEYELAESLTNKAIHNPCDDDVAEYGRGLLNGESSDRVTRPFNVVLELIENSILALQHTPNARLSIHVSGNQFAVEDNGPGMSPSTVFDALLIPGNIGWVKCEILKDSEVSQFQTGYGFTTGLAWCDRVVVETRADDSELVCIEIVVNAEDDIRLISRSSRSTELNTGTRIQGELSQPLRLPLYPEGPACRTQPDSTFRIEPFLLSLIESYCWLVDERTSVFLNGKLINDPGRRGAGPKIVAVALDRELYDGEVEIPVYVAPISEDKDALDYYPSKGDFTCLFEFYQNGLFLFRSSLSSLLPNEAMVSSSISQLSEYQKSRLNKSIVRVFLPGHFPLLLSKLGLPLSSEAYIIEQVVDAF